MFKFVVSLKEFMQLTYAEFNENGHQINLIVQDSEDRCDVIRPCREQLTKTKFRMDNSIHGKKIMALTKT